MKQVERLVRRLRTYPLAFWLGVAAVLPALVSLVRGLAALVAP